MGSPSSLTAHGALIAPTPPKDAGIARRSCAHSRSAEHADPSHGTPDAQVGVATKSAREKARAHSEASRALSPHAFA